MLMPYWILIIAITSCLAEYPEVTTPMGKIRGHYKTSFNNNVYAAFEGIPYALPPDGPRRFAPAQRMEKWEGTWVATYTYECAQTNPFRNNAISGDEDCLYLNVYVPHNHKNVTKQYDVIVHIHGGGFMFGSSHLYSFPGYLMDRDVIFVTFNYRLGIFGFLSTEDHVVPGNNGLKDQVLALKWVKSNIEIFGGNPNSITITGASAGSASVHLHYLSPMSKGLFNRGWSTSGTALNSWTFQSGSLDKAKIVANALGCPTRSTDAILKCLKSRHFRTILSQMSLLQGYKNHPPCIFGPVVERWNSGTNTFLLREPTLLFQGRNVQNLPWVTSFVSNEGYNVASAFKDELEELNAVWPQAAPFILTYNYTLPKDKWEIVAEKVKTHYLGKDECFTNEAFEKFVKIYSDRAMVDGIVKGADMQAKASNAPVYVYEFSYIEDTKKVVGHGDDNQYFYYDENGKTPTPNELKMKEFMVDLLVTYAKTGKPSSLEHVWKPLKPDEFNFLNISGFEEGDWELMTNKNIGNSEFWRSVGL